MFVNFRTKSSQTHASIYKGTLGEITEGILKYIREEISAVSRFDLF